ncbi:MAG: hypothetical protein RIR00_1914 [Pseudomonadota bacterium]|jgi:glycosyltransferase involved in cell wall biosynthesis
MRFAFVITNLNGGGAEKAIVNLAQHLQQAGHTVRLLACEAGGDYPLPSGLTLEVLQPGGAEASKGWLGKRLLAWRLRGALAGWNADLLVSTLPFADEVAALSRLPRHCCRIANTLSAEVSRLARHSPAKARRRLARYRAVYGRRPLIAVSHGVAADLQQALQLQSPVTVIHNPFDAPAIRRAAAEPCAARPTQDFVLHVGRFAGQKRHDLLLDAWQRLAAPPLLVLLANPEPGLLRLIAERGLENRVLVAGFQRNPYPWMAAARLLVLCSDHEGLPNVLVEALLCGTPVLSTDCPSGPREILGAAQPEALVPCDDPTALAERIAAFLDTAPDPASVNLEGFAVAHAVRAYEALAMQAGGPA